MQKLKITGFKTDGILSETAKAESSSDLEVKESYVFSTARAGAEIHELKVEDDDLLEFVFDDNTTWMGNTDILHDLFPNMAQQKRDVGDAIDIPLYLETDDANRSLLGDIALKALHVFTKKAVVKKVKDVAANLEKKILENLSGVYHVASDFKLEKITIKQSDKPFLLFIHGTNSSTSGSFAEIQKSELWGSMQGIYGHNILALQHETLTKSPLQNAIEIFKAMPNESKLHIITHSRGGLVGDVLARYCDANGGFTEEEIAYLEKTNRTADLADIKTLTTFTESKKLSVEKFIRVACPAYGTTILSKRLDHFLNISLNLLGTLFGPAAALFIGEFKNLISAAVGTKNDPNELPGLEAMNPDSAFLKVLNNPIKSIKSPLTVISGNCGIKLNLKALLVIASKLFYMRDNDLVVDTKSMYCGTRRTDKLQYFYDHGAEVDHVHYFKNKKTQDAILIALKTASGSIPNFVLYEQAQQPALDRNVLLGLDGGGVFMDKVGGKKPIAILLPGIMGSNLKSDSNTVWINYFRFLVGELSRLDIDKKNVTASSLIKTSYAKLADHLCDEYDVVTLPFDWRRPLADAAALLNSKVEKYLAMKVPIKIVGHSMGGVVARDFIINHPATWKKLNASKDFKLLFLGAPLGGSYRIPYVLAGKDPIINKLSKVDVVHTKKELLDMFRRFPGLLGLLPLAKDPADFADIKIWQEMKGATVFDWIIPDKKDLDAFGAYRDKVLEQTKGINMDNMIYIAGRDSETVFAYAINNNLPGERIVFKSTYEGDQSVTWDSGIPAELVKKERVYYVNVTHGALANEPDMFLGISEILKNGKTELMTPNRPKIRGTLTFDTVEKETYDTGEEGLTNTLLGLDGEKQAGEKAGNVPMEVSVSNGDLFYSRYPIMVGHFINDGITSAEKAIDYYSSFQLSQRHRLSQYPGAIGTSELFLNYENAFKGTIVIGLGTPGRLSTYQLATSVEMGAVKYLLEMQKIRKSGNIENLPDENGISLLLIGGGYGGLSIESSIRALLQGVEDANDKLDAQNLTGGKPITKVEFVELYEDRCLQSLYILSRIESEEDSAVNIRLPKKQFKKLIGAQTRIPIESDNDWWTRISIALNTVAIEGTDEKDSMLRFSSSTGSAREEQRDLMTSPDIINDIVDQLSTKNMWNEGLAKTFFELLIPNDFKEEVKKQANTLWVLDSDSAAYPWELLQDSASNALPLCCSSGMIRQMQLPVYRLKINPATGKKALVVGDPDLKGFPYAQQLPGAFKEAKRVESILNEYGFEMPNNCFKASSSQIINSLFKDEYKIIHLAGHGLFNKKNPKASGMLIGNGVFLSTREISQMSAVPELVFVNCCYLGKEDATAQKLSIDRYKLAANIGTQLIMNGVKVVIAAGWAVDDAAAFYFTGTFYDTLLGGANFGEAIKEARYKTFKKYPKTNTWGAYQCYGDPFYKITETKKSASSSYTYLIAQEAENDLGNLLSRADSIGLSAQALAAKSKNISDAVDKAGIRNAAITEKEAFVFTACNDYENAIAKFQELVTMEQAGFSVKALEKYCNIRAKLAVKKWQKGVDKNDQLPEMEKVIGDLKQLLAMSPTSERLSLLGSAYKRKSMLCTTMSDKVKALMAAADYYKTAFDMPQNPNKTYPLSNWVEIERILGLLKNRASIKTVLKKYKFRAIPTIKNDLKNILKSLPDAGKDMDFWNEIARANANLGLWLFETGKKEEVTEKMVSDAYANVWNIAGSQNKKIGELEHFDFLIDAYSRLVKSTTKVKSLNKLRANLEAMIK